MSTSKSSLVNQLLGTFFSLKHLESSDEIFNNPQRKSLADPTTLMEEIFSHKPQSSLPYLLFVLQLFSLQLLCVSYTLPDKFFINCGSQINANVTRRTFVGDLSPENSDSFKFTRKGSSTQENNSSTSLLYRTARIFSQNSSYEFYISANGTYMVRLHFYAFSSHSDFSTALFDVSASGFTLLHSFSMEKSTNGSPVIKEYLLSIGSGKFVIDFVPKVSSFAFINAIEVFLVPESFIPDDAPAITRAGRQGTFNGILFDALETVHRINVGGSLVTPDNDTLFRTWIPDDNFLYHPDAAKNSDVYSSNPVYTVAVSEYIAPDYIYQTAKEMNIINGVSNFNITWSFNVSKNSKHFVRFHFCDILSPSLGSILFDLYIYSNWSSVINPYDANARLASPFYYDYVVDSDASGFVNISIGPRSDSTMKNAFLNGLEIMDILIGSGLETRTSESKKTNVIVVVGSVAGGLAVIVFFAVGCFLCLRRRKLQNARSLGWPPPSAHGGGSSDHRVPLQTVTSPVLPSFNLSLKMSFADILYATNHFEEAMIIGKGGFGNVFRGTLRNGIKVAVKRSKPGSGQGFSEFQTEIMVLSKIRHIHLVSLIGYCHERSEMILVFEFMEKGTLRDHLNGSASPRLSWKQRLEICIGAAKGLHYLHKGCARGFIHRDVKSTNILLDQNFVAKVADFGLSRLGGPDNTHVSTDVKGTFGYLDPEYFRTLQLTEKSDVYSFGVVLLEVLCARPALDVSLPMDQVNLAEWAMFCKTKGTIDDIIDVTIKNQINPNSLRKFVETAEKCLQEYGADRPTMADVLWDLEYAQQLQQTIGPMEFEQYSSTDTSSAILNMPNMVSLPSLSMSMEKDDVAFLAKHMSYRMEESKVFSQLKINDAR